MPTGNKADPQLLLLGSGGREEFVLVEVMGVF